MRDSAGMISAVISWVLRSAAPGRATTIMALPGRKTAFSAHRKLSRSLRLARLRTTALPIWRDTASPNRAASWSGSFAK